MYQLCPSILSADFNRLGIHARELVCSIVMVGIQER